MIHSTKRFECYFLERGSSEEGCVRSCFKQCLWLHWSSLLKPCGTHPGTHTQKNKQTVSVLPSWVREWWAVNVNTVWWGVWMEDVPPWANTHRTPLSIISIDILGKSRCRLGGLFTKQVNALSYWACFTWFHVAVDEKLVCLPFGTYFIVLINNICIEVAISSFI